MLSRISPLMIAISVVCAILFVIGLLQVVIGSVGYSRRNAPITDTRDDINNRTTEGAFISSVEQEGDMKIARLQSDNLREKSLVLIGVGCIFCTPMLILGVFSVTRRRPRN